MDVPNDAVKRKTHRAALLRLRWSDGLAAALSICFTAMTDRHDIHDLLSISHGIHHSVISHPNPPQVGLSSNLPATDRSWLEGE
jgi:hypothetical protein